MHHPASSRRNGAIDAFRAITMFLMLFVNDMAGLVGVPHWLKHAKVDEDMMGFSDLVFPAFLFCVGLAVPLAIQARARRGADPISLLSHVAWRTVALVVMGIFTLHCENVSGGMGYGWYSLLMVAAFVLVWNDYPRSPAVWHRCMVGTLKAAGVALLIFLAIDRDIHHNPLTVGWWGILGLIGWTYAVSALIYIFSRGRMRPIAAAWAVVMLLAVVSSTSLIPRDSGLRFLLLPFVPGGWTLHALGVTGVLTTVVMQRLQRPANNQRLLLLLFLSGAAMLAAVLTAHPYWIISKIQATPTWIFFCLALFLPLLGLLHWVVDVRHWSRWLRPISAAGTCTLTCYMIPYVWYAVQSLTGWWWPDPFNGGWAGLARSAVFAFAVVWLAGALSRIHVKLKL